MTVTPLVLPDPDMIALEVASQIADGIAHAGSAGRRYLLGCPTGRTPSPTYQALARFVRQRATDLSHVTIVLMDEYLIRGPDGELKKVDPVNSYSCVGFANREIAGPLTSAAQSAGLRGPSEVWSPDPANPQEYDRRITEAGGIDLFILASGASDGHIAFNQPGTARVSQTHIVELGEATRRDNMSTFPEFTSLSLVPHFGISVGISTIVDLAKRVVMILTGADKTTAFARLRSAYQYDASWPATAFVEATDAQFYVDAAAAGTAGN